MDATLVWDDVVPDVGIVATTAALRRKWSVQNLPDPSTGILSTALVQSNTNMAPAMSLPANVPNPTVWLDATNGNSLRSDAAGSVATPAGGRIRKWLDSSGNNHHVSFPEGTAQWLVGTADRQNGRPLVFSNSSGSFVSNPLAGCGAYTVLAVWRLAGGAGFSAHPLSINGKGKFENETWQESIGLDTEYTDLPAPIALGLTSNDMVLATWEGNVTQGDMTWRILAIDDTTGGHRFHTTGATDTAWLTRPAAVGLNGRQLILGELLVWKQSLDATGRASLSNYLRTKWGSGILPLSVVISSTLSFAPRTVDQWRNKTDPIVTRFLPNIQILRTNGRGGVDRKSEKVDTGGYHTMAGRIGHHFPDVQQLLHITHCEYRWNRRAGLGRQEQPRELCIRYEARPSYLPIGGSLCQL